MEKWYAVRDAFFWWTGVWAVVTLGNRAILCAAKRRRREEREQYRREFMEDMRRIHAEQDAGTGAGHAAES